jgi:hypothetical protein
VIVSVMVPTVIRASTGAMKPEVSSMPSRRTLLNEANENMTV